VETIVNETPFVDDKVGSHDRALEVFHVLNMRQHDHRGLVSLNPLDRLELLHVADSVDDQINLSREDASMFYRAFGSP